MKYKILSLCESGQIENIKLAISLAKSQNIIAILNPYEELFEWLKNSTFFDSYNHSKFKIFEADKSISSKILTIVSIDSLYIGGDIEEVFLPKGFYLFKNLEELHISSRKIYTYSTTQKLPNIKVLRLYYIIQFHKKFLQFHSLKKLTLPIYDKAVLFEVFKNFKQLEELEIMSKESMVLPINLGNLNFLKEISIGDSFIGDEEEVPQVFKEIKNLNLVLKNLKQLEILKLYNIKIININEFIKYLPNLKELDLCGCGLKEFPTAIRHLKKIESIELTLNGLSTIPNWTSELPYLKYIDLD